MTKQEILQKLQYDTQLHGLSKHTQDEYYTKAKQFQNYYDKPATELGIEEINDFLYYLLIEKKLTSGTINTYSSGLKFLYEETLDMPINLRKMPRHKITRRIPDILTKEEVQKLFDACDNLRDKCMLMTMYSSGLRVSEVVGLRVKDIDSKKMQIFINQGKGKKDRYAILSENNLQTLREYWKAYRPGEWMFYSRNHTGTHITTKSAQDMLKKHVAAANITKKVTTHTLRHSFATHLMDDGTDIFLIKKLMGHSEIKTTCFYLHIAAISTINVKSPMDTMHVENNANG